MAKQKVKIPQKDFPFLKGDLNIDADSLDKLKTLQSKIAGKFKKEIAEIEVNTAKYYAQRLKDLTAEKAETVKSYDAEIKKMRNLVKRRREIEVINPQREPTKKVIAAEKSPVAKQVSQKKKE